MASDQSLLVGEKAIAVRAIEYRGEPLEELKNIGFNAVWINGPPALRLLQEAQHVGIYLICTPPSQSELAVMSRQSPGTTNHAAQPAGTAIPLTDPLYDRVLLWNLGDHCVASERTANNQWANAIRGADRRLSRPIICTAESGIRDYSRIVDILMLRREPIFTSFDLRNYSEALIAAARSARQGMTIWNTIQTQPDPKMEMQWELFGGNSPGTSLVTYEQIKLLTHMSLAAGSHGLLFTSHTPLTANDSETEYRRLALELINMELMLIEEWFSKGKEVPLEHSPGQAMPIAVLQTNRSRLLLPVWRERYSQNALGRAAAGNPNYVIPGIPENYDAMLLLPGGVRQLSTDRVAGGVKIALDEANLNTMIFFTSDPSIRSQVEQRSRDYGARAATLAAELARRERMAFETTFAKLRQAQQAGAIPERDKIPLIAMEEQESLLKVTQDDIDIATAFFEKRDFGSAYLQSEKSTRGIRVAARALWAEATAYDIQPAMTPVSTCFANLPAYIDTYNRAATAHRDVNRLPSGTAEDIAQWSGAWTMSKHRIDGMEAAANLASEAARSGPAGILMHAWSVEPIEPGVPFNVETAPIWATTSPGIPVRRGEMICVSGWINIPQKIGGSHDGVMVFDSIGGEALALRFDQTKGWQKFAFYRIAPGDGEMFLTLSLCGLGKVSFDDLEVTAVRFDPLPIRQPVEQPAPNPYWQRLNPLQLIPPSWGGQRAN